MGAATTRAVFLVAVLLAVGGAARAAPAPAPAIPAEAVAHYDLNEFEAALEEFKAAFRAVQDPSFLFNIAQCHRKLGHTADALAFYRNYVRRSPQSPNRAEAERHIAELERA